MKKNTIGKILLFALVTLLGLALLTGCVFIGTPDTTVDGGGENDPTKLNHNEAKKACYKSGTVYSMVADIPLVRQEVNVWGNPLKEYLEPQYGMNTSGAYLYRTWTYDENGRVKEMTLKQHMPHQVSIFYEPVITPLVLRFDFNEESGMSVAYGIDDQHIYMMQITYHRNGRIASETLYDSGDLVWQSFTELNGSYGSFLYGNGSDYYQAKITYSNGNVSSLTTDLWNSDSSEEGYSVTFSYDYSGRPEKMEVAVGSGSSEEKAYTYTYEHGNGFVLSKKNCENHFDQSVREVLHTVNKQGLVEIAAYYKKTAEMGSLQSDGLVRLTYNAEGLLTSCVSEDQGLAYHYEYDAKGNLTRFPYEGTEVSLSYNSDNTVQKMETTHGSRIYTYDAFGRLVSTVEKDTDGREQYRVEYTYDEKGRTHTTAVTITVHISSLDETIVQNAEASISYDDAGLLTRIDLLASAQGDGEDEKDSMVLTYDASGLLAAVDRSGETILYHYDDWGRVSIITRGDETATFSYTR